MAVYRNIHLDPVWDCGPYELTPEEDAAWWIHCDHCYEVARFERFLRCECNGFWCEGHAPFRHPDDWYEPQEVEPMRWQSARQKRRDYRAPTPATEPLRPRRWNVTDLANISAALEPGGVHRRCEAMATANWWYLGTDIDPVGDGSCHLDREPVEVENLAFVWPGAASK